MSDRDGTFHVVNVPAGSYTLSITSKGFAETTLTVEVPAGKSIQENVTMQLPVEKQEVQISADTLGVDTSAEGNASSIVIKGKDLDALSDDPDELQSELNALAGPAAGPNGAQIFIDGFSGGQLPPKSSIREIRINQNPFSAQYDKLGYGRIEILTKPGTDKLHGSVMAMGNSSAFNSLNPFVTEEPSYYSTFFVGNAGGPLGKSASWFGSIFRRDNATNSIINAVVLAFNLVPAFPLDGGRVLRSIIWGATGDLQRATYWSALFGQAFAWVLIAWGIVQFFAGNWLGDAPGAMASNVAGTVSPRAEAVFRLIANSNLVGACTGKSAELAPLRMRSM